MNRRTFIAGTIGALANALLPEAHAARTCSPNLSLDFFVQRIPGDLFSESYFGRNDKDRRDLCVQVAEGAKALFVDELGITPGDITTREFYRGDVPRKHEDAIGVFFVKHEEYIVHRFKTWDAIYEEAERLEPGTKENLKAMRKSGMSRKDVNHVAFHFVASTYRRRVAGAGLAKQRRIYLFSREKYSQNNYALLNEDKEERLLQICRIMGRTLCHEIGHVAGVSHSSEISLPDGRRNIMFGRGLIDPDASDEFVLDFYDAAIIAGIPHYGFKEEDKKQVQKYFCQSQWGGREL